MIKARTVKIKIFPTHYDQLVALKRIEGQIRGIQNMIQNRRYCVDILTQLHSIVGAILGVEDKICRRHLEMCVGKALRGKSESEKQKKINEVLDLLNTFRRG